jgi:predicted negative regulator of RcsB-dependent stress response
MQAQETTTVFLLKMWPWFEENKKPLIAGTAVVAIVGFFLWFSSEQRTQKEIEAGQAMGRLMVSQAGQSADAYLKVASDYSGTVAAQRAKLHAATFLFVHGNYADAQTQFQQFLDSNPSGQFNSQAWFGVAACLAAQDKLDDAITAYKRVIDTASTGPNGNAAKFALAGIEESKGQYNDALTYYEDVANTDVAGTLGAESRQRIIELRGQQPASGTTSASPLHIGQ